MTWQLLADTLKEYVQDLRVQLWLSFQAAFPVSAAIRVVRTTERLGLLLRKDDEEANRHKTAVKDLITASLAPGSDKYS